MNEEPTNPEEAILRAFHYTRGRDVNALPVEVLRLADALRRVHGDVYIANESHGIHLYMASPVLLVSDGDREFEKRHLAVNASKYFGYGEFAKLKQKSREKCALCMKSKTKFTVPNLLQMVPLEQRGHFGRGGEIVNNARPRHEIDDGRGNMIPDHPGVVIPLDQLPPDHPAIFYLQRRGIANVAPLVRKFGAAWCESEAPPDRTIGRFYRRIHAGWRDTPQGRIIFHGWIHGVRRFWQGRYLEVVDGDNHFVWHPYDRRWVLDASRAGPDQPWVLVPPFNEPFLNGKGEPVRWAPRKYINGLGCQRAEWGLLGFDSAVACEPVRSRRYCVVTEGPLDANQLGDAAVAGVGSYFSPQQARLVATEFPAAILAYDDDKAGRVGRQAARDALSAEGVRLFDIVPPAGKDFGDLPYVVNLQILAPAIAQLRR